jgi:hypothetical protein
MTAAPTPETLTELKLPASLQQLVNEAYIPNDRPIVISYVNTDGDPASSFRGSAVALGETQLAVWTRNPESGLVKAGERNANMLLLYREPNPAGGNSRAVVTFRGRARPAADEAERRRVYDTMVQKERDADQDYKGCATVIDLTSVTGFYPGYRLQMKA